MSRFEKIRALIRNFHDKKPQVGLLTSGSGRTYQENDEETSLVSIEKKSSPRAGAIRVTVSMWRKCHDRAKGKVPVLLLNIDDVDIVLLKISDCLFLDISIDASVYFIHKNSRNSILFNSDLVDKIVKSDQIVRFFYDELFFITQLYKVKDKLNANEDLL